MMQGLSSSAPGSRSNPSKKASPTGEAKGPSSTGGGQGSAQEEGGTSPTYRKGGSGAQEEKGGETEEEEKGVSASMMRKAQLPPPSSLQPEKMYMVTMRSGNTFPLSGREIKSNLLTPTAENAAGLSQPSTTTNGQGGGGQEADTNWYQDVLMGVGEIGGIYLQDYYDQPSSNMTSEERRALERIAQERRQRRQRRQQRNKYLLIGGAVLVGGLGLWYATRSSGSAPAPAPPPPPAEPQPEEDSAPEPEGSDSEPEEPVSPSGSSEGESGPRENAEGTSGDPHDALLDV
jgi:hypothetical protein